MRYIAVCFVLLSFISAACQPESAEQEEKPVLVEDVKYTLLPGGARIVTGTLYNPSADPVKGAQIQISLFDENNIKVSSMNVTIQNVQPGERKTFREPVDSNLDIRGAKVRSVLIL